jgi:hypothetical protein
VRAALAIGRHGVIVIARATRVQPWKAHAASTAALTCSASRGV